MQSIKEFGSYIINQLSSVEIIDIIDIILVSVILYYTFKFLSDRRAGKLAVGVGLFLAVLFISEFLKMRALNFLLTSLSQVGLIALIIVFQPEFRSALEKMGTGSLKNLNRRFSNSSASTVEVSVNEICSAVERLSQTKTGALMVFERDTKLGDVIKTGTVIDADISAMLINNIFYNKAPLHDGAVIVRGNKLYSAGCFLPLSSNADIIKDLGTRHRAAIGMSENSDALVLVVSEETGTVSIAKDGKLERGFNSRTLHKYLMNAFVGDASSGLSGFFNKKGDGNAKSK